MWKELPQDMQDAKFGVSQKLTTRRSVTELLLHNLLIQINMLVYIAVRTGTQKALHSFD